MQCSSRKHWWVHLAGEAPVLPPCLAPLSMTTPASRAKSGPGVLLLQVEGTMPGMSCGEEDKG